MDEISSLVITNSNNLSSREWFSGTDDDSILIPLEGGFFSGNFVPPPPRPLFLDEGITTDGLTTCDLCTWAWQNKNTFTIDKNLEAPGQLGWVLTLVIVSLVSALIGAIVMIIVLHCKRLKGSNLENTDSSPPHNRPPISTPDDKIANSLPPNYPPNQNNNNNNGVWSWLSRRSAASSQLENSPSAFIENHYTHMEDTYNTTEDALYAELDVESDRERDRDSNSPAYQNSAYTDPDAPTSSAPSSAYYSDLSISTVPDRAYEVVGLVNLAVWAETIPKQNTNPVRLAAISENVTIPSDYV